MNPNVETYLKQATRGLWGRKRQEVKEELGAHIEGRIKAHLIARLDESTAVERTLAELGQPAQVSAGMMSLHSLPQLVGLGALATATLLLIFALVTESVAQSVPGTLYFPSKACVSAFQQGEVGSSPARDFFEKLELDSRCDFFSSELWMRFETLKPVLESQGITVTNRGGQMQLSFPDGEKVTTLTSDHPQMTVYDFDNTRVSAEPGYFDLWELVKAMVRKPDISLSIEGWDNPTFRLGDASFNLGTDEQPFKGEDFYDYYLNKVLFTLTSQLPAFYTDIVNPRTERIAVAQGLYEAQGMRTNWSEDLAKQITLMPGSNSTSSVYGVVVNLGLENPLLHESDDGFETDSAFLVHVARTEADGSISLTVPANEALRFVDRFGANPEPGEAVLVELQADAGSWFNVVPPEQIGLE